MAWSTRASAASRSALSRTSAILDGTTAVARLQDRVEIGPVPPSLGECLLLLEPGLGQAHQERRLVGAGRQPLLELPGRLFGLRGQKEPAEELPQYQRLGIKPQRRAVSLRGPYEVPLLFLATRQDQVDVGLEAFGQPASRRLQALDRAAETPRVLVLDPLQELEYRIGFADDQPAVLRDDLRGLVIPTQLEQDQGEPLGESHVRGIGLQALSPGRQRGLVLLLGVFDHSLHREDAGIVAQ